MLNFKTVINTIVDSFYNSEFNSSAKLTCDENHNLEINGNYVDIRNKYIISSIKLDDNLTFLFENSENDSSGFDTIKLIFYKAKNFESDYSLFSSLDENHLFLDEVYFVPQEYLYIDLPIRELPYIYQISDKNNLKEILDSVKSSTFRVTTKNGITFYFKASQIEVFAS